MREAKKRKIETPESKYMKLAQTDGLAITCRHSEKPTWILAELRDGAWYVQRDTITWLLHDDHKDAKSPEERADYLYYLLMYEFCGDDDHYSWMKDAGDGVGKDYRKHTQEERDAVIEEEQQWGYESPDPWMIVPVTQNSTQLAATLQKLTECWKVGECVMSVTLK